MAKKSAWFVFDRASDLILVFKGAQKPTSTTSEYSWDPNAKEWRQRSKCAVYDFCRKEFKALTGVTLKADVPTRLNISLTPAK